MGKLLLENLTNYCLDWHCFYFLCCG